jgi:hypothetical protein
MVPKAGQNNFLSRAKLGGGERVCKLTTLKLFATIEQNAYCYVRLNV